MRQNGKPLLDVCNLGKRFQGQSKDGIRWVVEGMSFALYEGEFVTLIGPSGSGKSTLLNMIAQIDIPSKGEILFRGEVINDSSRSRPSPGCGGRIGYVMQDDNLLPWRTLRENVEYPLVVQGRLNSETRARVDELIDTVGLGGFEGYYPHQLSGGMRKRASIIRTLAYDPPVILMDEPFGALDAESRLHIQSDLVKLWQRGEKTILFVTHDINEAIALGDRTITLTKSPACVRGEHVIDIPRPRALDSIVTAPQFPGLFSRIRAQV
ncbi:ABC transporter ATP-binding protein [Bradyrhizobium japonicum]|uniref:ABC transporter ATP-binding protein n=1 Tax=Bradyrhizobium japonicum TaxID=375 RepID=UPI00067610BB|nr:ABC transporter ATP-binding protein [Bradyrhizobium japonicum]